MPDALAPLRINAVELLRQPGASRPVEVELPGAPLGVEHERLDGDIVVILDLESTNDGILVAGEVRVPWAAPCRRCLRDIVGVAAAEVDERYQIELTDPDAFPIENGQLDLTSMVREVALLELDGEQLCRDDCAGLCQVCGVDRNTERCSCDTEVVDHRWAALDGLVLDD